MAIKISYITLVNVRFFSPKVINKKLRYKRIFFMFCYREVFVYIQAIYCQLIQKEISNRKYWRLTKQF